jgi:hypothetical protein
MQIKQKQNKKLLSDKSAAVALRKIASEKAKQSILALQSELEVLKATTASNEKKLELREKYSSRLDEMIRAKLEEVRIQKNVLKDKDAIDRDEAVSNGPDVMQYILRKAEIFELLDCIKTMERKIEIAKGNIRNSKCREIQAADSFHWQPGML